MKTFLTRYFHLCSISVLVLVGCGPDQQASPLLDADRLVRRFDETLAWLDENAMRSNGGYMVIGDSPHYEIVRATELIPQALYSNVPEDVLYHTKEPFRGKYVLVSEELGHLYISDSPDFGGAHTVMLGDMVVGVDKWFVTHIAEDSVRFNYGWLCVNSRVAESLIDMYEVTCYEPYLAEAGELLTITAEHIDSTGKWMRYTAFDSIPRYTAGSQSILMRALHKFVRFEADAHLSSVLNTLALTFKHGTEGVYNHWANSRIGEMIRDDVIGSVQTDYERLQNELDLLYSRIESFGGKIPYIMDENNPQYPDFRETYQTFDTFLLAMMSKYALKDIHFDVYFQMCFDEAIDVNYGPYFANNTLAALSIFESYAFRNDEFMISQQNSSVISNPPERVRYAVAKLQGIAGLMKYNSAIN